VRITFFGDSHVAADFYTGRLRQLLQQRFGNGGPGFVPIGVPSVRHEQVLSQRFGKWQREPASAASYQTQGDGRYGLSGMRAAALNATAEAQVKLQPGALAALASDTITWELVYRLNRPQSLFSLQVGSEKPRRVSGEIGRSHQDQGTRVRASRLQGFRFDAPKDARIRVATTADRPEFFGLIGETARAGLVLDTLGINGARARTILGWHAGTWQGELAEREPSLVVLAYGTNEVGDGTQVESYRGFYQQIRERVREAAPEAECLLIGPTERVDAHLTVLPRAQLLDATLRQTAAELGCAYHSWLSLIAESGGLRAWTQGSPQLAANDRIHLTRAGYQRLAEELFAELMSSYGQIYGEGAPAARSRADVR
jgi:lysophospholipase L1-like esterase